MNGDKAAFSHVGRTLFIREFPGNQNPEPIRDWQVTVCQIRLICVVFGASSVNEIDCVGVLLMR